MGTTDTSLITVHKKNWREGTRTLQVLPRVLQRMLSQECYEDLGVGNPPQSESELTAMQKQENEYLDGLLNLEHCTEIDISKKREKDDETIGAQTAMSGLTNVSPQTQASTGTGAWAAPLQVDIVSQSPTTTNVSSTLTTTHPEVNRLEQERKFQQQTISKMEAQIQSLQRSVQELVDYKISKQTVKEQHHAWK